MNNPLISIIVPVYNVEKYIRPCLDSILSQTYTNWEAILVDDGSTDGSGAVCDEYVKRDNRFMVVHKENEGVSKARNLGIKQARGEYILFLDSDDLIKERCVENLTISRAYPLVVGGYEKFGIQTGFYGPDFIGIAHIEDLPSIWNESPDSYWWFVWGKLFRRDVIIDNNIEFKTEMFYLEDFCFVLEYLSHIDFFYLLNNHDILHLIEETKYSRYRMDYAQLKRHMQIHEECFSLLERRCNAILIKMRQRIAYRHYVNFENYLLKSNKPITVKFKNAFLFRSDRTKPNLFNYIVRYIVLNDFWFRLYRIILKSHIDNHR